ncbi:MAG: nitric oxide synthase [Chloroflexi bacterium RBG_16_60_22]|nr:MAG: nitric oxide synthase [Chloroflexi bacterium RBG_16_60_22]
MPKVLIAYASMSGHTEQMARYIAEGVRISGCEAVVKNISKIKDAAELEGFDGYIFGSPTYYRDMAGNMKTFLFLGKKVNLEGKLAGAFGTNTHDGGAPAMVLETMEYIFKMEPFSLGCFDLKEAALDTREGLRSCQDYGRVFGEKLGK